MTHLTEQQIGRLWSSVEGYDFEKVAYDFRSRRELRFDSYRTVESFIREQLVSIGPEPPQDGLSNVLYWGYASSRGRGRQHDRVTKLDHP